MKASKIEEWKNLNAELKGAQARIAELLQPQLEIGSAVRAQLEQITTAQKVIAESMKSFNEGNHLGELVRQIQERQTEFSRHFAGAVKLAKIAEIHANKFRPIEWKFAFPKVDLEFASVFSKYTREIGQIAARYNAQFKVAAEIGESFQKVLRELPDTVRVAVVVLGQHGWFMDEEMSFPDLIHLAKALQEGKTQSVDEALCAHFEGRLDAILEKVTQLAPARSPDIAGAVADFRAGGHKKAILVILATADGLCIEVTGRSFFTRVPVPGITKQNRPATALHVDQLPSNSLRAAALEPLRQILPLNKSKKERTAAEASLLNRHAAMHGESIDYGTRVNTLRAVSFLNYIVENIVEADSHKN